MKLIQRSICIVLSVIVLALFLQMTCPRPADSDDFSTWSTVANQELAEMRAGFITNDGLPVTFDWYETAKINGVTVLTKSFNSQTPPSPADLITIIQSGQPGTNTFAPSGISNNLALTVIQNTCNNKIIAHNTTINATVTSLSLVRDMHLSALISAQMIHALH